MGDTSVVAEFAEAFGVWEEARPYLHMIVDEEEMCLVVAMRGQAISAEEASKRLDLPGGLAADLLERAYGRCVVDKETMDGGVAYAAGSFYQRLDHFAKYENWDDIPLGDRQTIDRRFLDEFTNRHRPNIERKRQGLEAENALPNDTVMLLPEVEAMVSAATHIAVQPCDCRRLGQYCDRPVETCIWLDDAAQEALDRGHGRRLGNEEAIALLRWADKKGLMHTADSEWATRGLHAICNCCACDCYPFRAAQELGTKGVWPRSRYVAVYRPEDCNLCGACVQRCQFGAFYRAGTKAEVRGKENLPVLYDPERCWGCGLCANTCPSGAIQMEALQ